MNLNNRFRALAIALFVATAFAPTATLLVQDVSAQTASSNKMIGVLLSKGVTKCITNPISQGGWVLQPCNKTDPLQQFSFDTQSGLTQGVTITQPTANGVKCLIVKSSSISPIAFNQIVAKSECNQEGSSLWLWNKATKQIILAGSPPSTKTQFCLTAVETQFPPILRLGDCSKPDTLTKWVVNPIN